MSSDEPAPVCEAAHEPPRRVAEHIVDYLAGTAGVRHMFGLHGANIEDIYDAVLHSGGAIRAVMSKHEFSAGTMADGYSRVGGGLAAVAVTSGGGALNLVPALGEAYSSRIPLIALVGQPPTVMEGRGAFQDQSGLNGALDGLALFSAVSVFCERLEKPEAVTDVLARAVRAAREKRGPAVLLLPKDVQQAVLPFRPAEPVADALPEPGEADAAAMAAAVAALAGLRGAYGDVLVVAGTGVAHEDTREELAELAEQLGAVVAVEPDGKDAFDSFSPRFVGIGGAIGHPTMFRAVERARCVVLVGTRFPQVSRSGTETGLVGKPVVCFSGRPPYVAEDTALVVPGELRTALRETVRALAAVPYTVPEPVAAGLEYLPHERSEGEVIALREVVETIGEFVPDGANIVSDAGNAGCGILHFLPTPAGGRHVLAMGMGGMGFSFGAGIGAALANGRRTYVLAGDGSFLMHGMEVHTAVEHRLPITYVLFNNNGYAACSSREELFYSGASSFNVFRESDFGAGVAAMFPSVRAATVRTLPDLHAFLAASRADAGPCLVSVEIRREELPPYLPFVPKEGPPMVAG